MRNWKNTDTPQISKKGVGGIANSFLSPFMIFIRVISSKWVDISRADFVLPEKYCHFTARFIDL
jgi:hypothetical protein